MRTIRKVALTLEFWLDGFELPLAWRMARMVLILEGMKDELRENNNPPF